MNADKIFRIYGFTFSSALRVNGSAAAATSLSTSICVHLRFIFLSFAASLLGLSPASATPYATYIADLNQAPQNPTSQGWTVSAGGLSQGIDDGGTLAWILNDNG